MKKLIEVQEKEIYLAHFPLLTENGTLAINGVEKIFDAQLRRAPGVYFFRNHQKSGHPNKIEFLARIVPNRGERLTFELDKSGFINARIRHRLKVSAATLLLAFGYSPQELLNEFYEKDIVYFKPNEVKRDDVPTLFIDQSFFDVLFNPQNASSEEKGDLNLNGDQRTWKVEREEKIAIEAFHFYGRYAARPVFGDNTGALILDLNEEFTEKIYFSALAAGVSEIHLLRVNLTNGDSFIRDSVAKEDLMSQYEALKRLGLKIRGARPKNLLQVTPILHQMFFNANNYDLSPAGRKALNYRVKSSIEGESDQTFLSRADVLAVVKELKRLKDLDYQGDDLNHLRAFKVLTLGELIDKRCRLALKRFAKTLKRRLNKSSNSNLSLSFEEIFAPNHFWLSLKNLFATSSLFQPIDQNNPLAIIAHHRRLSTLKPTLPELGKFESPALEPYKLTNFAWVNGHPSHLGRVCPLDSPLGPNFGHVVSLAAYARITQDGFIETPFRLVENGVPTLKVAYLSLLEESESPIALSNAPLDKNGHFLSQLVPCRLRARRS
jgi:DNA-directed RNA polymerase subunit beta